MNMASVIVLGIVIVLAAFSVTSIRKGKTGGCDRNCSMCDYSCSKGERNSELL